MNTEQKARAYDKVREKIALRFGSNVAEEIFSEIEMSKDERIRKAIIELVRQSSEILEKKNQEQMIAWLEKQKSEEINVKALLTADRLAAAEMTGRLKERKDIVENPQKYGLEKQLQSTLKTEWNEEDEKMCQNILECLKNGWKKLPTDILKYESWLKSPKYQNCWKPTKEQMRALHDMNLTGNISYVGQGQTLIELYNDLKKLKGE